MSPMVPSHTLRGLDPSDGPARRAIEWGWITAKAAPDGCIGDHHAHPVRRREHPVGHHARHEVHPDEIGDVPRARMGRHLGECSRLHDVTGIEDHHPVDERIGVDRIVG